MSLGYLTPSEISELYFFIKDFGADPQLVGAMTVNTSDSSAPGVNIQGTPNQKR